MKIRTSRIEAMDAAARWRVVYLVCALLGAAVVLWLTRMGPGMSGDSTSYLMGAENLLEGRGFNRYSGGFEIRPISGFPPFYSAALAGLHFLGLGLESAGRALNAALLALTVFLSAFMVRRYSGSGWAGLVAAGLLLTADSILVWHAWLMSEGLYLGLMVVGLVALLRGLEREAGRGALVLAGLCFAAASLTRYIGLGLIAVAVLSALWLQRGAWRERLIDAGVVLAAALPPVVLWLRRNAALAGTMTNRELALHPVDPNLLRLYLAELSSWFVPHEVPLPTAARAGLAILLAGALLVAFLWLQLRARRLQRGWPWVLLPERCFAALPWLAGLMIAAQLAILAANSLFLDASTTPPAVPRYLTPVFVLGVIFACASLAEALGRVNGSFVARLSGGYAVALILFYILASAPLFQDPLSHLGYTGYRVRWQAVVETLQSVATDQPLVSNNPELVYALTGRPAYVRPIRFDHYQERLRGDYEIQMENTKDLLQAGGVYVIFHPLEADDEATIEFTGAEPLAVYPQASFYGLPDEEPLSID